MINPVVKLSEWWHRGKAAASAGAARYYGSMIAPWETVGGRGGIKPPADIGQLVERDIDYVYICVDINAVGVASVPLRLYMQSRTGEAKTRLKTRAVPGARLDYLKQSMGQRLRKATDIEEVEEHPAITLLEEVNTGLNQYEFKQFLSRSLDVAGNAFIYIVKNTAGRPVELYPILPQYVEIKGDKQKGVGAYIYKPGKLTTVTFDPEEVVHVKYLGLDSVFWGKSPLYANWRIADVSRKYDEMEIALLDNDSVPDILLVGDADQARMPKDEERRLLTDWGNRFRGTHNRGKIGILYGLRPEKVAYSPREMNFLQGRNLGMEKIANTFKVPVSFLKSKDVNRANAEAGHYQHAKGAILPRCRVIEEKLNEKLLPMFDESGRLFFAFDNPVPEDAEQRRAERQNRLSLGFTTINEERAEDNLEPVDWGDVPILPMTMAPFGAMPEPASPPLPPEQESMKGKAAIGAGDVPNIRLFTSTLTATFLDQRREIIAKIEGRKEPVDMTIGRIEDIEWWLPDPDKWARIIERGSIPFLKGKITQGGADGAVMLASVMRYSFNVQTPEIQNFIAEYGYKFAKKVNQTIVGRLRKQLGDGIEQGETVGELKKRILGVYAKYDGSTTPAAAERIARTEMARAYEAGKEASWMQSGVVQAKEWSAADDACPWCLEMDGKVIALGLPFAQDSVADAEGNELDITYEETGVGYPPLHPNCRCADIPVIMED